jgi:hypothetical protein
MYLFNQQFFRNNVFLRNFGRIAGNVLQLAEGGEFEAPSVKLRLMFIRS